MQQPIQITFRDMGHSDAAERYVRDHAAKLEQFDGRIVACKVALEVPHKRRSGGPPRVRIDLTLPHDEIVVDYTPAPERATEDLYAAIDQAFDRAVRQIEDHAQRKRRDVKHHESPYREGVVTKLWTYDGYGFIETPDGDGAHVADVALRFKQPDGDEVYFHQNSVRQGHFHRLERGARVRFVEEMGEKGPQASTVVVKE
jgi:ribosomal subunit interface protein